MLGRSSPLLHAIHIPPHHELGKYSPSQFPTTKSIPSHHSEEPTMNFDYLYLKCSYIMLRGDNSNTESVRLCFQRRNLLAALIPHIVRYYRTSQDDYRSQVASKNVVGTVQSQSHSNKALIPWSTRLGIRAYCRAAIPAFLITALLYISVCFYLLLIDYFCRIVDFSARTLRHPSSIELSSFIYTFLSHTTLLWHRLYAKSTVSNGT